LVLLTTTSKLTSCCEFSAMYHKTIIEFSFLWYPEDYQGLTVSVLSFILWLWLITPTSPFTILNIMKNASENYLLLEKTDHGICWAW
jgi:hypothetical protein